MEAHDLNDSFEDSWCVFDQSSATANAAAVVVAAAYACDDEFVVEILIGDTYCWV